MAPRNWSKTNVVGTYISPPTSNRASADTLYYPHKKCLEISFHNFRKQWHIWTPQTLVPHSSTLCSISCQPRVRRHTLTYVLRRPRMDVIHDSWSFLEQCVKASKPDIKSIFPGHDQTCSRSIAQPGQIALSALSRNVLRQARTWGLRFD
jgi:hypothetical protein